MSFRRFVLIAIFLLAYLFLFSQKNPLEKFARFDHNADTAQASYQSSASIDLDVTYISREPRYSWDSQKQWPDPGERVTFTAHIINKGTVSSGNFTFQWKIDDQIISINSYTSIPPQGEVTQAITWYWQSGRHDVSFEVDPQNLIPETAETNNKIEDVTDALTIGFWVEETVYDDFNNIQNSTGSYSWEDWAQHILQKMNWIFENSVYPKAPKGILTRVRLDNITIVPDGTLFDQGPWHAPYDTIYDGRWGFSFEEYGNGCQCCPPPEVCYDVPWWVIHELGHYLFGRVDLYGLDVQGGDVKVLDENGYLIAGTPSLPYIMYDVVHYASRMYDLMHDHYYSIFSDYHAYSLNLDWPQGQRTQIGWNYIYNIPSETKLRILDNNNQPMPNMEVSMYQALPGDGSSGPYSQNFDNTPDIVGVTDAQGLVSLGNKPFGEFENYSITAGIALAKVKNLNTGVYRYIWIEVTDLNLAYWRGLTGIYILEVHFPSGLLKLGLSDYSLDFTVFPGSNPAPKIIDVNIAGEGVQYWNVEMPNETWLRAIPSPSIVQNHYSYPPGPLTLIIESSDLPIGEYTTEVIVRAGEILDSLQTIPITVHVFEPECFYIPIISVNSR